MLRTRIAELMDFNGFAFLTGAIVVSVCFYLVTKKTLRPNRKLLLNTAFKSLAVLLLMTWLGFALYQALETYARLPGPYAAIRTVVGLVALVLSLFTFIKLCKNIAYHYLFLLKPGSGVPELLVNMITLVIYLFTFSWLLTSVLEVRLAPLLATSALVSVVLGLALQDTLGNLFAGIAMQFDKPYEIGDWIEVSAGEHRHQGEVQEITWRATVLNGFLDEVIVLPNRLIAQSEVSNFSGKKKPIYRALGVYLDTKPQPDEVRNVFFDVLKNTEGVLQNLESFVMLREMTEKGMYWRLAYPVVSYSHQYLIVDRIHRELHKQMTLRGWSLGRIRVEVQEVN